MKPPLPSRLFGLDRVSLSLVLAKSDPPEQRRSRSQNKEEASNLTESLATFTLRSVSSEIPPVARGGTAPCLPSSCFIRRSRKKMAF